MDKTQEPLASWMKIFCPGPEVEGQIGHGCGWQHVFVPQQEMDDERIQTPMYYGTNFNPEIDTNGASEISKNYVPDRPQSFAIEAKECFRNGSPETCMLRLYLASPDSVFYPMVLNILT